MPRSGPANTLLVHFDSQRLIRESRLPECFSMTQTPLPGCCSCTNEFLANQIWHRASDLPAMNSQLDLAAKGYQLDLKAADSAAAAAALQDDARSTGPLLFLTQGLRLASR